MANNPVGYCGGRPSECTHEKEPRETPLAEGGAGEADSKMGRTSERARPMTLALGLTLAAFASLVLTPPTRAQSNDEI